MKKAGLWVVVVVIALLILTAVGVHRWFNPPAPAAQLFFNGTVLTMDPQQPVADAMLVKPVSYTHLTLPTSDLV